MKILNVINFLLVGFPLTMAFLGCLINDEFLGWGLLSLIITGVFQVIVGLGIFMKSNGRNIYFGIYLIMVAIFFSLWHMTYWKWIFALPPLLALYMTVLLFLKLKKRI